MSYKFYSHTPQLYSNSRSHTTLKTASTNAAVAERNRRLPAASSNDAGIDPDRLYTTPEAAQILRLADRTLERMRGQGDGPPYVKLGQGLRSRVVYRGADLITWIEGQVRNSTSEPQP